MRQRRRRTSKTTEQYSGRDENETGAIERQRAELLRLSVSGGGSGGGGNASGEGDR